MNDQRDSVETILGELKERAPSGYAAAFHIRFTTPTYLFQTYPGAWLSHYSENGLVMSDPTVHWGFENEGFVKWSSLKAADTSNVLGQAAKHGLNYGMTWAIDQSDSRSVGSFARGDREFTDEECEDLLSLSQRLHQLTTDMDGISKRTGERLEEMSVRVTHSVER